MKQILLRGAAFGRMIHFATIVSLMGLFATACSRSSSHPPADSSAVGQSGPLQPAITSMVASATLVNDTVTVYKSPTCGCCTAWVDSMRAGGFTVVAVNTDDIDPIKAVNGVPKALASCHTAFVGGYVIEGHVPPADVHRLLRERPAVRGLAVPGMPMGSPGMEGSRRDPYQVIGFGRDGRTSVFAQH